MAATRRSFLTALGTGYGTGSSAERTLWRSFASAWVALAKSADPNNPATPAWPPYEAWRRATMIFDREVRVDSDPRAEIRKFWAELPPAHG